MSPPIGPDDPTRRAHSRPALSIPAQVLSDRGFSICEKLNDAEYGIRCKGDHAGANGLRAFREHLAHLTRMLSVDEEEDAKVYRRTVFFAASDYAGLLLRPFEAART